MKYTISLYWHPAMQQMYPAINLEPKELRGLLAILANVTNIPLEVDWLERLIQREVPDFSEPSYLIIHPILWGSRQSKFVTIDQNGTIMEEGAVFLTADFLRMCQELLVFMQQNNIPYRPLR